MKNSSTRTGYHLRRVLYFTLVTLTTLAAMGLLSGALYAGGITPLKFALLVLYAILISWIAASFWTAMCGFLILLTGRDRYALPSRGVNGQPRGETGGTFKTALVMPICDEDQEQVFAALRAMYQSLIELGQGDNFDVFILSDTRDPDIWVQEELQWQRWCLELKGKGRVFYRHRQANIGRKSGNIADFCKRWGGCYRYTIMLDADSIMAGPPMVEMVRRMEQYPQVAMIQAPPVSVNRESFFARMLQFASVLYGRMFAAGLSFWQLDTANSWGHNVILRVQAFTAHCGLPKLPGREPFGGEILSHDFVESALLRRAGWETWLAYDLEGSYEEIPPTLIDYAKRDRRWCQGNLQHSRLIYARDFHPLSRVHFFMGVMSYLASPLWLLFLIVTGIEAYLRSRQAPVYFFGDNLFPVWPVSYAFEMTTVLFVTLAMLFLPKLFALALLLKDSRLCREFGGFMAATAGVVLESLFSVLLAPVLMLFQSKFVMAVLLRKNVGWPPQQRGDRRTGFTEALQAHGGQMLIGIGSGIFSYLYLPSFFFWWFTPVLAGLLVVIPVSILSSSTALGRGVRRLRLFLTPQESATPRVLQLLTEHLNITQAVSSELVGKGKEPWLSAIIDPHIYALHASLLPDEVADRRRKHYLEGLIFQLQDEGTESLQPVEKRALLSHRSDGVDPLHILLWAEPPSTGKFQEP